MSEATSKTGTVPATEGHLPGVPAGTPATPPLAGNPPADPVSGLAGGKKLFGGNVGRKKVGDGLSPEQARQAKLDADAKRKRDERLAKKNLTPPPPLPAASAPLVESVADAPAAAAGFVAGVEEPLAVRWMPADFNGCSREIVSLAEAWRINSHTKLATTDGLLSKTVVEQIARDAAFPPSSKKSLSESSPETLAHFFNALNVPLAVKPFVTGAPALCYLILRDIQGKAAIHKMLEEERALRKPPSTVPS